MKRCAALLLLICILCLCGCGFFMDVDAGASPSPSPTQTPEPTEEPTPTPNIPLVDESLLSMEDVTGLLIREWPDRSRLSYMHQAGRVFEAEGGLYRGEDYVIYLLQNTGYAPAIYFEVEANEDGADYIRAVPEDGSRFIPNESLSIRAAGEARALELEIEAFEQEGFSLIHNEDIVVWNSMFDSNSMLYGALPYEGRYALMQAGNELKHMLLIETERGSFLIIFSIEQMRAPTQLFYFFAAMLSTFRVA